MQNNEYFSVCISWLVMIPTDSYNAIFNKDSMHLFDTQHPHSAEKQCLKRGRYCSKCITEFTTCKLNLPADSQINIVKSNKKEQEQQNQTVQ